MRSRGFTLIEMIVVITVLALMASFIVPNVVALNRSSDLRGREAAIQRAPIEARNEARRARVPVTIRIDGDDLVLERQGTAATADQPADTEPQEFKRIALGGEIRAEAARMNGEASDLASWRWTAYPDGTSDRGGVEFSEGSARKSLVLEPGGAARWVVGEIPDTGDERWPAGELEQRGTATTAG